MARSAELQPVWVQARVVVNEEVRSLELAFKQRSMPSGQALGMMGEALPLPGEAFDVDFSELEIKARLGRRGFGIVHRALWNGCEVAVKELKHTRLDPQETRMLQRELQLIHRCRHPNACDAQPCI